MLRNRTGWQTGSAAPATITSTPLIPGAIPMTAISSSPEIQRWKRAASISVKKTSAGSSCHSSFRNEERWWAAYRPSRLRLMLRLLFSIVIRAPMPPVYGPRSSPAFFQGNAHENLYLSAPLSHRTMPAPMVRASFRAFLSSEIKAACARLSTYTASNTAAGIPASSRAFIQPAEGCEPI